MILSNLNYLAIFVASLIYFVIGALWFSPKLFGTIWAKGHNLDMTNPDRSGMGMMMTKAFLSSFLVSIFCGFFMKSLNVTTFGEAFSYALLTGIGFTLLPQYINSIFMKKSVIVILIDAGYHVVSICVVCMIIVAWQ